MVLSQTNLVTQGGLDFLSVVMLLNLLVMLFVRGFRHPLAASLLQLIGAVLGVFQVALVLRILFVGLGQLVAPVGVGVGV
jgi:hypothetical protein